MAVKQEEDEEVAVILNDGTLKFNGYKYRKCAKGSKQGTRWKCCVKACDAFLIVSSEDDIVSAEENHNHGSRLNVKDRMKVPAGKPKGVLVTSRHGNKNLLYRGFYYRRKYSSKGGKIRWVCSSLKNCRACAITTSELEVIKIFQEHSHGPPAEPIISQRGRTLLLYRRYTYSKYPYPLKNGWRWYCSRVKKCRANIVTDNHNHLVSCSGVHHHPPMTRELVDNAVRMSATIERHHNT